MMPKGVPKSGVRKPRGKKPDAPANGIGDKGPAKAAADNSAPAEQHGPSDATFFKHFRLVSEAKTQLEEMQGIYRSRLKAAKTDGIMQGELIGAMAARRKQPDEVVLRLKTRIRYLTLLEAIPRGTQLGMFSGPNVAPAEAEAHSEWQAAEQGYTAGRTGKSTNDNPHKAGSAQHAAWGRGFLKGQESIANQMGANAKVAPLRKRGTKAAPADSTDAPAPVAAAAADSQPRLLQ